MSTQVLPRLATIAACSLFYFIFPISAWCPAGFTNIKYYDGYCFGLMNNAKTWVEANEICNNRSEAAEAGQLLRLENSEKWDRLRYGMDNRVIWTAGFTLDYQRIGITATAMPNTTAMPSTTASDMTSTELTMTATTIESQTTNSTEQLTTHALPTEFVMDSNATWYWSNSSQPGVPNSADRIVDLTNLTSFSSEKATGSCLAVGSSTWRARACSQQNRFVCQYQCVRNVAGHHSTITSPNYPSNYPADVECEWLIDVGGGQAVLRFQNFAFEGTMGNCIHDFVEVYEHKNSAQPISRLCGSSKPSTINSPSQYLYIKMTTDGSLSFKGFQATVRNSLVPTQTSIQGLHGVISTDDFPQSYDNDLHMSWLVDVQQGVIHLMFTNFDLQPGNGTHCIYDFLQIRDGSANGQLLGTFCGPSLPSNVTSRSGVLHLTFSTDSNITNSGFRALYRSDKARCVHFINKGRGEVLTPGYPSTFYGRCTWYIDVLEGIAKISFDKPRGTLRYYYRYAYWRRRLQSCSISRLEILDGRTTKPRLSQTFCGMARRMPALAQSRYLIVRFQVQRRYSNSLFRQYMKLKAAFRSTKNCSQTIQASNGTVTSPNYPSTYDPLSNCTWLIDVLTGNVSLRFNMFRFQSHTSCGHDRFEVFDGNSTSDRLMGTFCGSTNPGLIKSTSRYLLLRMTSDATIGSRGFSADFWSSETPCPMWGFGNLHTRKFNNVCYGFIKSRKTWLSARSFCEGRNSSLVRFETRAEFNAVSLWIYEDLKYSSNTAIWTAGYRRSTNRNQWLWSTIKGDMAFESAEERGLWAIGEPDNGNHAYMKSSGLYDATYSSLYIICEETTKSTTSQRSASSCSPPPNIRSGFYSPPQRDYSDGASVTFSCDSSHVLVGNATLTCKNRLWDGHMPSCKAKPKPMMRTQKSCSTPPSTLYRNLSPANKIYKHGSQVTVTCYRYYKLTNSIITCLNGKWTGTPCSTGNPKTTDSKGSETAGRHRDQEEKSYTNLLAGSVTIIIILTLVIVAVIVWQVSIRYCRNGKRRSSIMEMG